MRGWQLILMHQVIAYGVFDNDEFKNLLSKSEKTHCNFVYLADADIDVVHKLQSIYQNDASRVRNISKANSRLKNPSGKIGLKLQKSKKIPYT